MTTLPATVSTVRVTGTYLQPDTDGTQAIPCSGTVTFTSAVRRLIDAAGEVIVIPSPVVCTLDADGRIVDSAGDPGVALVATDDPDLMPSGWTWRARVDLTRQPAYSFSFALPVAGGPLDLSRVTPVGDWDRPDPQDQRVLMVRPAHKDRSVRPGRRDPPDPRAPSVPLGRPDPRASSTRPRPSPTTVRPRPSASPSAPRRARSPQETTRAW